MSHERWQPTRLGNLVSIKHGWPFKSQYMTQYLAGRPIVVGIGNFEYTGGFRFESTTIKAYTGNYPQEFNLKPGDILLVMTCQTAGGEILGIPGRIPNDGRTYLHNQRMGKVIIKDKKKVEMSFLYWLFLTSDFNRHLAATATGTKILHTAPERIESFNFLLPPFPIQRKIADILSAYDDLIENNTRRIAILEETAQMLYQEWFVKFRFPGYEQVKMVESELGMIPEGWRVVTLRDITSMINRGISPKYDIASDSLVINQKCIRNGKLNLDEARRHITKFSEQKLVQFGDILINSTGVGTLGRLTQVYQTILNCTVDSHVTIVRPNSSVNLDFFGLQLLQQQHHFESLGIGSTGQTELGRESIANTLFLLPPQELQRNFADTVSVMRKWVILALARNANLRRTRDMLLPKLISGEIDVSSWVEGDVIEEEAEDMAASVAGTTRVYNAASEVRKVAEAGTVEPIKVDELEWHSLWE